MSKPAGNIQFLRAFAYVVLAVALISLGAQQWLLGVACLGLAGAVILFGKALAQPSITASSSYETRSDSDSRPIVIADPFIEEAKGVEDVELLDELSPIEELHELLYFQPEGYEKRIAELISQVPDINESIYACGSDESAISRAIFAGVPAWVIRILIEHGAELDLDQAEEDGWLARYVENGKLEDIKILMDLGLSPSGEGEYGESCFHLALDVEEVEKAAELIRRGALEPEDENWMDLIIRQGNGEVLDAYLASPNGQGVDLSAWYESAIQSERRDIVVRFVANGADPFIEGNDGSSAIEVAAEVIDDELYLMAMPLTDKKRYQLLGYAQASVNSDEFSRINQWIIQLENLEHAWKSGFGNPDEARVMPSFDSSIVPEKVSSYAQAQALVLAGAPVFEGQKSLFDQAISKRSPMEAAIYLESLTDQQAQERLGAIGNSELVSEIQAILWLRRRLRSKCVAGA